MSNEKFDNRGTLHKNNKNGNEKRPDYRGRATIAGVDYQIAGWVRQGDFGGNYLSLAFTIPREVTEEQTA